MQAAQVTNPLALNEDGLSLPALQMLAEPAPEAGQAKGAQVECLLLEQAQQSGRATQHRDRGTHQMTLPIQGDPSSRLRRNPSPVSQPLAA